MFLEDAKEPEVNENVEFEKDLYKIWTKEIQNKFAVALERIWPLSSIRCTSYSNVRSPERMRVLILILVVFLTFRKSSHINY